MESARIGGYFRLDILVFFDTLYCSDFVSYDGETTKVLTEVRLYGIMDNREFVLDTVILNKQAMPSCHLIDRYEGRKCYLGRDGSLIFFIFFRRVASWLLLKIKQFFSDSFLRIL